MTLNYNKITLLLLGINFSLPWPCQAGISLRFLPSKVSPWLAAMLDTENRHFPEGTACWAFLSADVFTENDLKTLWLKILTAAFAAFVSLHLLVLSGCLHTRLSKFGVEIADWIESMQQNHRAEESVDASKPWAACEMIQMTPKLRQLWRGWHWRTAAIQGEMRWSWQKKKTWWVPSRRKFLDQVQAQGRASNSQVELLEFLDGSPTCSMPDKAASEPRHSGPTSCDRGWTSRRFASLHQRHCRRHWLGEHKDQRWTPAAWQRPCARVQWYASPTSRQQTQNLRTFSSWSLQFVNVMIIWSYFQSFFKFLFISNHASYFFC